METKAQRLARIEKAMVLSGIAGVGVFALAGCWAGFERQSKTTEFTFETGAEGKADKVLPQWVPDDASDIDEVVRTTGNERILRLKASAEELPEWCEPSEPPVSSASLEASWWPADRESESTLTCNEWFVSEDADYLYGFKEETIDQNFGG
ncbi:hypothetical protein [Hoyosella subflava]|uniref:Lipoprotein n=1 Tax=Hoyosella subflava (strain DSM 45089 / JCM 17490 / NBRC 109087 / DQS3-9A1) TaxID=443218 RepID=F6EIQ4_HOYSD|nr:hypothetical protein [Hoyosella subflava]AEF38979.1 hypothetical protein AS9A_0524 [Hoyosella subflava DQS3-9A1]